MKGFKPTGYGPSSGFKFPAGMGFTGSTGSVTSVAPYVRRKAFASGGFVRQDKPRMKSESVGDSGSALVRRSRPTTQLDAESGGRSPLRPGFQWGGVMNRRAVGRAMEKARAQPAATGPRTYTGGGALGAMLSKVAREAAERAQQERAVKRIPTPSVKGRFYDKGGKVVRPPKDRKQYTFAESVAAIPEALKVAGEVFITDPIKRRMYNRQRTVEGRNESVGEYTARTQTGKDYSRGGKAKRMGYAEGGAVDAQRRLRAMKAMHDHPKAFADLFGDKMTDREIREFAQSRADAVSSPNHRVNLKKTRTVKPHGIYAGGGPVKKKPGVTAAEAKRIAERTVGEHVRYPAPKGHKGLERVMRKADGGEVKKEHAVQRLTPEEARMSRDERRAATMKRAEHGVMRLSPKEAAMSREERRRELFKNAEPL